MRVLVTAASKHGATTEIAGAIAEELNASGIETEFREPAEVRDLAGFDGIVIGSATYMGHWLADARKLVERVGPALEDRPVWVFSSGPVGDPPKPQEEPADVRHIVESTHARDHALFAGKIERARLGPMEKAVMSALHVPDMDNRDWEAIRAWARGIAGELRALRSQP